MNRRLRIWSAVACLLALSPHALPVEVVAAPTSGEVKQAEAKALEAKAYYARGLFKEAAETFMEAFALSKAPDMMYNAARAYEAAKILERARALYETYLTLPGVSDDGKQQARQRIADISLTLDAKPQATPPQPPTQSAPASPAPVAPAPAAPAPVAPAPAALPAPPTAVAQPRTVTGALPAEPTASTTAHWWWAGGSAFTLLVSFSMFNGAVADANAANAMDFSQADAEKTYNAAFDKAQSGHSAAVFTAVVGTAMGAWAVYKWLQLPKSTAKAAAAAAEPRWWVAPSPAGVVFGGAL